MIDYEHTVLQLILETTIQAGLALRSAYITRLVRFNSVQQQVRLSYFQSPHRSRLYPGFSNLNRSENVTGR